MKLNKNIRSNVAIMCGSYYFVIAFIMAVFLMLSGYIYTDDINEKAYSVISLMTMKNPEMIAEQAGLNWRDIYLMETPGYIWMFAPVIVTLPYIAVLCPGNSNTNIRFELFRTSKKRYILGKVISGMFVSGMIMAIAQVIYGAICFFTIGNDYISDNNMMNVYTSVGITRIIYKYFGKLSLYFLRCIAAFLYGMLSSLTVIFLSAIIKNKYLVFSIPFMLNYFYVMFMSNGIKKIIKGSLLIKINQIFMHSRIQSVFLYEKDVMIMIGLFIIIQFLVVYATHYLIMERRCDCCER